MIFFKADVIFASSISKFGKLCPPTDRDVLKSPTESTISTALIHNIASVEKLEQETYHGLETRFPTLKCRRIKEFIEMHS